MATLVYDCPHCGTRRAAFSITISQQQHKDAGLWNVFSSCPACAEPLVAVVRTPTGQDPKNLQGDIGADARRDVSFIKAFPKRVASKSPESVPKAAANAFVEGAENLKDGRYTSAVTMFRRAIDVGTKLLSDEINAWKLDKRIDALANAGLITKDLQTWAHKIRLEGNEAIHEIDEPTKEQATELQLFTELVLTYLYTLPAKVKANLPADTDAK
jgi:hypothetical protein